MYSKRMDDHVCVNNDSYSSEYYRMLIELTKNNRQVALVL